MGLEGIVISELSQTKKDKYCTVWYHLYVESKNDSKLVNKKKGSRLTDKENKLVVTCGGREGKRSNVGPGGKLL